MKKFKIPSAYSIVFIALIFTAILTYFIPVSVYDVETGKVIVGATFDDAHEIIEGVGTQPAGLWDIFIAPIKGFQAASEVGVALLIAGGFLGVLNYVGALEAGIGRLLTKFQGTVLIAVMMFIFAVLGTVFGLWEEIPAFTIVIIPLFVLAGYDVMTGIAVLFVGATIGNMASIVNPFSTGAAVAAIGNPELSLGSGILLRMVIFLVLYILGTFLVVQYANSVKADPSKSIIADLDDVNTLTDQKGEMPELTKKRLWSIIVFISVVVILIFGYVPWAEFEVAGKSLYDVVNGPLHYIQSIPMLSNILGANNITPYGDWYFNEFSFLFLTGSILLALINKLEEKEYIHVFVEGARELLSVVLVLSIAKGISIIMGSRESGMSVTFVYWISTALENVPLWIFGLLTIGAFIGIGLFLQTTSGVAGISMPILGAVAAGIFATSAIGEIGGQIILISAFTIGLNFISGLYPGATVMGTLELVNVPYDRYLRFMLRMLLPILVVGALLISIAPYIGLVK